MRISQILMHNEGKTQHAYTRNTNKQHSWGVTMATPMIQYHMITNHWNNKMSRRKGGAGGRLNESANLTGYPVNRRKFHQSIDGQQKQREYQNYDMLPNQIFHLTLPHRIYQQALQKISCTPVSVMTPYVMVPEATKLEYVGSVLKKKSLRSMTFALLLIHIPNSVLTPPCTLMQRVA